MAVLPCMLSYSYIFRRLAGEPGSAASRYWDFIRDYGDSQYAENCREWCGFAEEKCGRLSEEKQGRLRAVFERASLLEYDFWTMSWREPEQKEKVAE